MARHRWLFGAAAIAALVGAAPAGADPDDLLPVCSGNQTPTDTSCRVDPSQATIQDDAVGANPQVPVGVDPGQDPVIGSGSSG